MLPCVNAISLLHRLEALLLPCMLPLLQAAPEVLLDEPTVMALWQKGTAALSAVVSDSAKAEQHLRHAYDHASEAGKVMQARHPMRGALAPQKREAMTNPLAKASAPQQQEAMTITLVPPNNPTRHLTHRKR